MKPNEPIDRRDLWKGLRVIWVHTPRGGYGYQIRIPATVVGLAPQRVEIEIEATGARRFVKVESLREMSQIPVPPLSQRSNEE